MDHHVFVQLPGITDHPGPATCPRIENKVDSSVILISSGKVEAILVKPVNIKVTACSIYFQYHCRVMMSVNTLQMWTLVRSEADVAGVILELCCQILPVIITTSICRCCREFQGLVGIFLKFRSNGAVWWSLKPFKPSIIIEQVYRRGKGTVSVKRM